LYEFNQSIIIITRRAGSPNTTLPNRDKAAALRMVRRLDEALRVVGA
jgi:hypothetical protein